MTPADADTVMSILAAARRGARSVGATAQIAADAAERAFVAWSAAVLRNRSILDANAWAFRVGANAARRIAGHGAKHRGSRVLAVLASNRSGGAHAAFGDRERARLRALLAAHGNALRGRQLEVLEHLLQAQASFHAAARALRMDRTSLRRSFQSGLQRLRALATSCPRT